MVEFCPAPTMFTESFTYSAPWLPVKSFATFGSVSVYVPAASWMVSVPAVALALSTASRMLQEDEVSALLTLLQAFVMGEVGVGSSKRLGKKVGSGSGIITMGVILPECKATTPGRPSILVRMGNAATGDPS